MWSGTKFPKEAPQAERAQCRAQAAETLAGHEPPLGLRTTLPQENCNCANLAGLAAKAKLESRFLQLCTFGMGVLARVSQYSWRDLFSLVSSAQHECICRGLLSAKLAKPFLARCTMQPLSYSHRNVATRPT